MRSLSTLALSVLSLLLILPQPPAGAQSTAAPAPAEVVQFTPQGTVKGVRQVSARFSEPMVPLGDPRVAGDGPFVIECVEPGTARWVDDRNWAYDFARDLPGGLQCRFTLRSGLTTLAGAPVAGQQTFAFTTGGPAIRPRARPYAGSIIEEEQVFILTLDTEPIEESVRANVWFVVEGITERVAIDLVEGEARRRVVAPQEAADRTVVVLKARQRFPNNAKVSLVWGKGVTSRTGLATEQDQVLDYKVRQEFKADFHCVRENRQAGCNPLASMWLEFSASLASGVKEKIVLVGPGGKRWAPYEEEDDYDYYRTRVVFVGPFPEASTFRLELPAGLTDHSGRPLLNARRFPLTLSTAEYPPLAKFPARFGIIEWKADPALPVTVRNLEPKVVTRMLRADGDRPDGIVGQMKDLLGRVTGRVVRIEPERGREIQEWLRRLAVARRDESIFNGAPAVPQAQDITLPRSQSGRAFEVIGIPMPEPGFYLVELASTKLGASLLDRSAPMYVPAAALVTNLSVHLKWGRDDALAWVTTLDRGEPVPGALVTVHDCEGAVLWKGSTDPRGIARIGKLPDARTRRTCSYPARPYYSGYDYDTTSALHGLDGGLFVTARSGNDLSFVHSSWVGGIEPWRYRLPDFYEPDPVVAHTILDRSLFRAGETVHMKHLFRKKVLKGFSHLPAAERPSQLSIRHVGSDDKRELPLTWDAAGIAESTFAIPKEAKLGAYVIVMEGPGARERVSGRFQVEEFRVPLMKASIKPPAAPQVAVTQVPLDLGVQYLAGGGASKLPVTLRSQIRRAFVPVYDGYEDLVFASGRVKAGPGWRPSARYWSEGGEEDDEPDGRLERAGEAYVGRVHQTKALVLDAAGTARAAVTDLPKSSRPLDLLAELEFRDPNGEVQTVSRSVTLWPAKWLVGIKPDSWLASKERLGVQVAVVDVRGRPVRGAPVRVDLFEHRTYSHRKRLVGGFYGYTHSSETVAAGEFCRGATDARGRFFCDGKPPVDGHLVLEARVTDTRASAAATNEDVWVAGSEDWWFTVSESDRMDLLPEKRRVEPGQTARLQVRMPFREATALVAVEREGSIIDASVVTLSGKSPVVDVPILDAYSPNVFVSVLAVRGRVGGVQPTAMVDLGRPAFKLGVTELVVGWRPHELKVRVSPDRATYQVREKAVVKVAVRTARGQLPPPGSEVAVAAVDEGLLELLPNESWKLLEAMMGRRWHGISTATAQMQVIGKRHYGLKALPQGGGGGRQLTRELFDTLLLWNGRVTLNARGEVTVEVPLNDSLTAFRIVAVATGGTGLFGTGQATIRTTQDLMVLPGVAPLVREGDRFRSEFTLRNTTGRAMEVVVNARAAGLPETLAPQTATIPPAASKVIGWEITAPLGVTTLRYELEAREKRGRIDRVRVEQRVQPATPVRTYQATLFQLDREARRPVERPADAIPGRGGVQLSVSASLTHGLDGVREWWEYYPYACLEQKVSKAVALRDESRWREIAAAMPSYVDDDGLLKYFPNMDHGSEVLTAYVLALAHESGWAIPDEVRRRASAGLKRFVDGSLVREAPWLTRNELPFRKLIALEALSRYGEAEPRLLGSLTIDPNLWPTSAVLDWWSILTRTPGIPDREARLKGAETIVRSRLNLQGTRMGFSNEESDFYSWLMVTPDRSAVRLILVLLESGRWREDVPRLVRGVISRQRRGAWDVTVTNVWGILAVEKFTRAFEAVPVTGTTTASLAGAAERVDWGRAPTGDSVALPWPAAQAELGILHTGTGRPWVTVQSRAAIPLTAPLSSGYRIKKTITPILAREPGKMSRGDVLRVRLEVEAQAATTWVAVNDPIPAGAAHLGAGLARDSQIALQGERAEGWAWPAFEERAFDGFRAYYEYVPKGSFAVEYTIRLNQSGTFHLPATRVEALYAPEMFGELPNAPIEVEP